MRDAHEKGSPVMRPCFYDFPDDEKCWEVEDQYMYGAKYLCAPVLEPGVRKRMVYLPRGKWVALGEEAVQEGGVDVEVECPIERMPVFVRQS